MACSEEQKDEKKDFLKEAEYALAKNRRVFLWGPVEDSSAEKLVKQFLYLDSISNEDIYFFINSPGGVISSGLSIYDCIKAIKSPVVTICAGQAASFGAVLLCAGTKGKRYAWPNARIMIHQPLISGEVVAPASDLAIQAEEMLRIRDVLNGIFSEHTGKSKEELEHDTDRDNFMSAEQAKKYGIVDEVKTIH
ncbi:MAG: ATP-dependent Clp protease proteolytic subunit [Fibromonadaceae bacterium]|jgi:ATP-dependent Clp protease protease subunit|nr:ATP-dependent Clp protease proteolytic subunit [Fibromonadaceae bacterium]